MKTFELEIITPESTVFKGLISSLVVPAEKGYMGVMAGHASFIGSLRTGKVTFDVSADAAMKGKPTEYTVNNGFIEIFTKPFSGTKVTILCGENLQQVTH
jgi:F0F1-type ATP synthase epsilon subunit